MKSRLIFWHTIIPSVVNAWLLDKLDCKALYQTKKETLSRRPFQAQVASSLILMHATPNRGPPSNRYRDGDIGESFASSEEVIPKRCKPPPPLPRGLWLTFQWMFAKTWLHISQGRPREDAADTVFRDIQPGCAASAKFATASQGQTTALLTITANEHCRKKVYIMSRFDLGWFQWIHMFIKLLWWLLCDH